MTSRALRLGRAAPGRVTPASIVRALLEGEHVDDQSTISAIESHLPPRTLNIIQHWGLTIEEIAYAISASPRRLQRKLSGRKRLDIAESDRLIRLVRVLVDANALIGDHDKAVSWLHHKHLALGNVTPLSLLATDTGVALVRQSLGVVAYGGVA